MAYDIQLTGFTPQQLADIRDAFVATQGPVPEGMSQSRFVKLRMFQYLKAVVKNWKRETQEQVIRAQTTQVGTDFQEDIA